MTAPKIPTVIAWDRRGFCWYWRWKSRKRPVGRLRKTRELIDFIGAMHRANPTWGATADGTHEAAVAPGARIRRRRRSHHDRGLPDLQHFPQQAREFAPLCETFQVPSAPQLLAA